LENGITQKLGPELGHYKKDFPSFSPQNHTEFWVPPFFYPPPPQKKMFPIITVWEAALPHPPPTPSAVYFVMN